MENAKKYLTIRKFSELTHTSIDTLKHYDAIGLLKPAYIGKNHYRYYLPAGVVYHYLKESQDQSSI